MVSSRQGQDDLRKIINKEDNIVAKIINIAQYDCKRSGDLCRREKRMIASSSAGESKLSDSRNENNGSF